MRKFYGTIKDVRRKTAPSPVMYYGCAGNVLTVETMAATGRREHFENLLNGQKVRAFMSVLKFEEYPDCCHEIAILC